MPLYEYVCNDCALRFELLRPAGRMNEPAPCPSGHASARRVLSTFAAIGGKAQAEGSSAERMDTGGGCGDGCGNCACGAS